MTDIDGLILEFEYGSRAHGTDTPESDTDIMGIFVEPKEYVTGILTMDTQERKSAVRGARSTKDDTDGVYYPLRKWAALAAKGNPTVLTALFVPEYTVDSDSGYQLVDTPEAFVSKAAGERFLGYMISQRAAMLGERNKKTNRPELVDVHGFDTKFAYHMLRLGIQGIDLMLEHSIELPMREEQIAYLTGVRAGKFTKEQVLQKSEELETQLRSAIMASSLPNEPNVQLINEILHHIYEEEWKK